jgi:hypothetical protein
MEKIEQPSSESKKLFLILIRETILDKTIELKKNSKEVIVNVHRTSSRN